MTADTNTNDADRHERPARQARAVCHDCDAEGVLGYELAHTLAERHAEAKGHSVEVEEVDR